MCSAYPVDPSCDQGYETFLVVGERERGREGESERGREGERERNVKLLIS